MGFCWDVPAPTEETNMRLPKKLQGLARLSGPDRAYMIRTLTYPGHWAKGQTVEEAWKRIKRICPRTTAKTPLLVQDMPEQATVDGFHGEASWTWREGQEHRDPITLLLEKPE